MIVKNGFFLVEKVINKVDVNGVFLLCIISCYYRI